ncbi:MAG TPA: glycosyltransferase [Chitinophaga sp.]|uniref:glycosyltransferase family 2 protein n=1 Tax=Chitinophaga sp. TaxID=1869181 RepID=UPI002F92BCF4
MTPVLTIGLPFYNNRSTLELALKSIFAQTYQDWELILLDDGSTDGSSALAAAINDPRVRLVADGTNKGLIYRLNQIAQLAEGKYLARMDADDLMDPERLEKQVSYLLTHPDVDLVDTGTWSIDEEGKPRGKRGLEPINTNPEHILRHAMLLHASVVGKRSWFLNNPYNKDFIRAEDYELWCRTYAHSKFARIAEPLYIVREGKVNVKNYAKSSATIRKIFRQYGPAVLSPTALQLELLKSRLKVLLYNTFSLINKHDYLSRKRNQPLTAAEQAMVNQIMEKINSVRLIMNIQ